MFQKACSRRLTVFLTMFALLASMTHSAVGSPKCCSGKTGLHTQASADCLSSSAEIDVPCVKVSCSACCCAVDRSDGEPAIVEITIDRCCSPEGNDCGSTPGHECRCHDAPLKAIRGNVRSFEIESIADLDGGLFDSLLPLSLATLPVKDSIDWQNRDGNAVCVRLCRWLK